MSAPSPVSDLGTLATSSLTRRGADKHKPERILFSSDTRRTPLVVIQRKVIGRGPENHLDRLIASGSGYVLVQRGRSSTFRSIDIDAVSDPGSRDSQVPVQRGQAYRWALVCGCRRFFRG